MFWKFNHNSSTHIEILLNKEDVSLHEVMDEEDVLQECKVQNKKLIDYLLRPDVMEELVTLTTVEPSGEVDERARYKYPNIACELLTCDVPALNERLAGDEALLGKLYAFLESDCPLNPLLASFFSKTIGVLVARKSEQNWYSYQFTCLQVLEFLKSKENCISLLLKHLGTSAIMDLMLKLITHVEGVEMKQNILNWLDSQRVVLCLVGLLDPSVDTERHCNAAQLLCDVIKMSRENQQASTERTDPDPILNSLESPDTVSQLLDHMLGTEKCETSIVGGISVLLTLLDCSKPNGSGSDSSNVYGSVGQGEEVVACENEQPPRVVSSTTSAIIPRLKDFHNLLLEPPPKPAVKTTAGILDPPLGNTRLQIAKLLAALIATNSPDVNRELAHLGTVEVLMDLFFKYSWNNFLHSQVEQCISYALNSELNPISRDETQEHILLKNIFIKCKLLQRVLDAWDDNESQQSKSGGLRRGYMGHLIKIANHIAQQAEKGPLSTFIIDYVAADTVAAWEAFVANTLAETNKTHQINLGGAHPVHLSSEDDDATYRDIPFPQDPALQQVFTDYHIQQIPQFIENYGFHDDEFPDGEETLQRFEHVSVMLENLEWESLRESASVDRLSSMTFNLSEDELDRQAELFKQVCAQKLQTLEDSEEDIWDDREQELTFKPVVDKRTRGWQNAEDAAANSSSDEEDRPGPEEREEVHMEVDSTDPWAASDLASEGAVVPVAVDAANPWSSGEDSSLAIAPTASEQPSWADFGSAGFADFEANFGSTHISASSKEQEDSVAIGEAEIVTTDVPTSQSVHELADKLDTVASSPEKSSLDLDTSTTVDVAVKDPNTSFVPESDDNANPSSSTGEQQQQLMDNYRFLSTRGLMGDISDTIKAEEEMTCGEEESDLQESSSLVQQQQQQQPEKEEEQVPQEELMQQQEQLQQPVTSTFDNTQPLTTVKPGEACSSQSTLTATPNGPI